MRRLLHIGIIVENLNEAVKTYELLGFKATPPIRLEEFNVTMVKMHGENIFIELAEPISDSENPMPRGVHHLAFNSQDLLSDLRELAVEPQVVGVNFLTKGKVFLLPDPNQGGLSLELIEEDVEDGK